MPTQLSLPGFGGGASLGNAQGVITIDTSLAQRAAVTLRRVGHDMGEAFKPVQTTINRLRGDLRSMGREITALGAGAGITAALGLNAARDVRNYRIQFEALLKDEQKADEVMRSLTDQANKFGIEVNEVWQLGRSLIPVLEDGAESLDVWVKRAALLASTNPLKGTTDAVRAIQEYLAGQTISLQRLFNIDPNLIEDAQKQFEDVGEQLDFILGRMGANEDAAKAMANEWVSLKNEIKMALAQGFTPLLETLGPVVRQFTEMLTELRETNPEILSFGAALISIVAVGAPLLVFLGKVIDSLQTIKALSIAPTLGKAGVYGAAIAGGAAAGVGVTRAVGRAFGDERLQEYGIEDAIETFKQALFIVVDMWTKSMVMTTLVLSKGVAGFVKVFATAAGTIGMLLRILGEKLHIESLSEAGENIVEFAENLRVATDEKLAAFAGGVVETQREIMERLAQVLFPPGAEAEAAADGGAGGGGTSVGAPGVSEDALAVFQEYQDERAAIEEETERRRNEIVQAAGDERARLEAQILAAVIEFGEQESRYEQDYYRNRTARAQAAGAEMARAEEDHQRQMARLRQDSLMRQSELIGSRDALGLARERRNYEIERQRAEEDNTVKLSRRNADFALEMAQMETQFQFQRARRAEDFEKRQATLELELALVNQRRDEELALLKTTTETQLDDLKNAALQRISVIDATLVAGLNIVTQAAATAGAMLVWLDRQRQALGSLPGAGRPAKRAASGGYVSGLVMTGEEGREFVLDAKTTRAAEQMVGGGQLTQKNVLATRGGGGQLAVHQNFTFHGDMSAEMRQWYRNTAKDQAVLAFAEVMG